MINPTLDEREFELINIIGKQLGSNQRDLSNHLNLSLGQTNMLIRRLVSKGYIRITQLNRRKVQYLLTPKGLAEKMQKSMKYTVHTINAIGLIKKKLSQILSGLYAQGYRIFDVFGESDLIILLETVFKEQHSSDCTLRRIKDLTQTHPEAYLLICTEKYEQPQNGRQWMDLIATLAKEGEPESVEPKKSLKPIQVPADYDYVGVYLTEKCFLHCPYCITNHHGAHFVGRSGERQLSPEEWIRGLNRLVLPKDVPITLQGGEPFLYKGVWEVLENVRHKIDIMTALPPFLKKENFSKLKTLEWNKREAPYPTIRVSYHKGQNDYRQMIARIAELQEILSIGLYYLDASLTEEEIRDLKQCAQKAGVELRPKEFLGDWNGEQHGKLLYSDAVVGQRKGITVLCKNTVAPIGPDGRIYLCHSDLYFNRKDKALGNILDETFEFPKEHVPCDNYGLCNECDVKIKTNHYQQYGYTSVNIKFVPEGQKAR